MTQLTANDFLNSPQFLATVTPEAMDKLAETHGCSRDDIGRAYMAGTAKVVRQVHELIEAAAEETARRFH